MGRKIRIDKIVIKDIKLRTFIAEGATRRDLAAHVYDRCICARATTAT